MFVEGDRSDGGYERCGIVRRSGLEHPGAVEDVDSRRGGAPPELHVVRGVWTGTPAPPGLQESRDGRPGQYHAAPTRDVVVAGSLGGHVAVLLTCTQHCQLGQQSEGSRNPQE